MKKTLAAFAVIIAIAAIALGPRLMSLTQDHDRAAIGGAFSLVDHTGKPVTDKEFRGKLQLIYFGYTFCPDVCPTSLNVAAQAMDRLGTDADKVTPLFITVDPERDTPEVMNAYVKAFHPRLVGLTGTVEQTQATSKAFKVFARKVEGKDGAPYTMDHSSVLYLLDRNGGFLTHFSHDATPDQVADGIRKHL